MPPKENITQQRTAKLLFYDKVIATLPGIERKGDTMPYTSLNGHMFSFLDKDDTLALRLSKAAIPDFIKKHKTKQHEAHDIVMKEYVTVPDTLLNKTKELEKYFQLSHTYVSGLKPKPTKKTAK